MSTRTLTLTIPDTLYRHFEVQAQAIQRTVDDYVLETLFRQSPPPVEDDLPADLQADLRAMAALSDEALWPIANSKMNEDKLALYEVLIERNRTNSLTVEGREMLESLGKDADYLMVRKSQAFALLHSRGHKLPSLDELE
ncbi:MAG: hypothetical protein KJZ86_15015 [Caldilineaceae bacterium]|nr:hypothetical protein [Caldilineaceae bacterium]HRJ43437.1 hypothetical protein [Caldilineaceae bacterium]